MSSIWLTMRSRVTERLRAEPLGVGNGQLTRFLPTYLGRPTRLATEVTAVYRHDWRGHLQLSQQVRYNLLPNSDVLGSVAGRLPTEGNLPEGWVSAGGDASDWTREVVASGHLDDGTPFVDYRLAGTSTTTFVQFLDIGFHASPIPAARHSLWTVSVGLQVVAGDASTGFREPLRQLVLAEVAADGRYLISSTSVRPNPTALERLAVTRRLAHPDVAGVRCYLGMAVLPGASVDVTLRLSQPQLEPGTSASAYLTTRGSARSAPDYHVDELAVITLAEPPPPGATLTWDGEVGIETVPSLVPPNATHLERVAESVIARAWSIDSVVAMLWNPHTCPENLLPWLAWTMSVDTWRNSWPLPVRRARVANALLVQRRKGTARSIADVVDSFGGKVQITEWWQTTPRGAPHTFALTLTLGGQSGETATAQYVDDVIAEVNFTKPVRSHFTFTQGVNLAGRIGIVAAARAAMLVRLQAKEAVAP